MSALQSVVNLVQAIYSMFFAWLPVSMQVLVGVILAVAAFFLVIKLIGAVLDAIPFL